MSLSIEKLQELSSRLDDRIRCYRQFAKGEADFGRFMKVASLDLELASNDIIKLEQVFQYVIVDGSNFRTSFKAMENHLVSWKIQVDLKIAEMKREEFPNEIIL